MTGPYAMLAPSRRSDSIATKGTNLQDFSGFLSSKPLHDSLDGSLSGFRGKIIDNGCCREVYNNAKMFSAPQTFTCALTENAREEQTA